MLSQKFAMAIVTKFRTTQPIPRNFAIVREGLTVRHEASRHLMLTDRVRPVPWRFNHDHGAQFQPGEGHLQ
jgi:hypothetical protein